MNRENSVLEKGLFILAGLLFYILTLLTFVSSAECSLNVCDGNITITLVDSTNPVFVNLSNYTHEINKPFSQQINVTEEWIDTYLLNDTSVFNISQTGLITNITNLSTLGTYWLNITVNDTSNNIASAIFYIEIIPDRYPSFIVYSPNQSESFAASTYIPMNITINENGTCWYTIEETVLSTIYILTPNNISMITTNNLDFFDNSTALSEGTYNVTFYCNDSINQINSTEVQFLVGSGSSGTSTGGRQIVRQGDITAQGNPGWPMECNFDSSEGVKACVINFVDEIYKYPLVAILLMSACLISLEYFNFGPSRIIGKRKKKKNEYTR